MTINLHELKRMMEAGTPGPWMNNSHYECIHTHSGLVKLRPIVHYSHNNPSAEADCDMIVAAINALPGLLAVVSAAQKYAAAIGGVGVSDESKALCEALAPFQSKEKLP